MNSGSVVRSDKMDHSSGGIHLPDAVIIKSEKSFMHNGSWWPSAASATQVINTFSVMRWDWWYEWPRFLLVKIFTHSHFSLELSDWLNTLGFGRINYSQLVSHAPRMALILDLHIRYFVHPAGKRPSEQDRVHSLSEQDQEVATLSMSAVEPFASRTLSWPIRSGSHTATPLVKSRGHAGPLWGMPQRLI